MSNSSPLSSNQSPRRQPKQKRGQQRVEKVLLAAAEVFAEVGYTAATTQQIADRANTAIGSIYQFFPDKLAIFHALEVEYLEQVEDFNREFFANDSYRPLTSVIDNLIDRCVHYLERPILCCIHLQFLQPPVPGLFVLLTNDASDHYNQLSLTQHAEFCRKRNPALGQAKSELLSEVAHNIYSSMFTSIFRNPPDRRLALYGELKNALYGYLNPYIGDHLLPLHSEVMICPHCQSDRVVKNGHHKGKQRYVCRDCDRQFLDRYAVRGYPPEVKQKCLDLHQRGVGFREIERQTGVSHNTVINWVKSSVK